MNEHPYKNVLKGAFAWIMADPAAEHRQEKTGMIDAPIMVEGSAGTPEQKRDLAKQISKSIEQSMRQTVVTELQRQLRPCNMLNSGKR